MPQQIKRYAVDLPPTKPCHCDECPLLGFLPEGSKSGKYTRICTSTGERMAQRGTHTATYPTKRYNSLCLEVYKSNVAVLSEKVAILFGLLKPKEEPKQLTLNFKKYGQRKR